MRSQYIYGKPAHCLNRMCFDESGQPSLFTKSCFVGWGPRSGTEAYTVMRCRICHDVFSIAQLYSMVHEYKAKLPNDPVPDRLTLNEQSQFRDDLYGGNPLASLNVSGMPSLPPRSYTQK